MVAIRFGAAPVVAAVLVAGTGSLVALAPAGAVRRGDAVRGDGVDGHSTTAAAPLTATGTGPPRGRTWRSPAQTGVPAGAAAQTGVPTGAGTAGAATVPRGRWQWPLSPRPAVLRPFVAPASTWGAGHRGVDLGAVAGQPVRAVADGTVTHVGVIAGRPTLTVTHDGGLRSTYEPVRASVHVGDTVRAGQVVGTVVPEGSHCSPGSCLHLGAVRGRTYLDPLTLLGPLRVRLLPLW